MNIYFFIYKEKNNPYYNSEMSNNVYETNNFSVFSDCMVNNEV